MSHLLSALKSEQCLTPVFSFLRAPSICEHLLSSRRGVLNFWPSDNLSFWRGAVSIWNLAQKKEPLPSRTFLFDRICDPYDRVRSLL